MRNRAVVVMLLALPGGPFRLTMIPFQWAIVGTALGAWGVLHVSRSRFTS